MPLDAVAVARAFEIMLPVSETGCTLMRNPHKDLVDPDGELDDMTVQEWMRNERLEFIGPVEQQKCEATDQLWVLCWTPKDTDTETRLAAASLPALAQWLQDNGLAFGN